MSSFGPRRGDSRSKNTLRARYSFRPRLELLEDRAVPWVATGNVWMHPELVTLSFMPDGTDIGGASSNLFASMNARFGSPATWQNQILKAAQVWAKNTNLNFAVVSDNGAPSGSGDYQQGDPGFGDIRIGGYNFGVPTLASAFAPPPINNYSIAGDIALNTGQSFNIGATYDLFTVVTHEFGHALGLAHSGVITADLYSTYNGVDIGVQMDDIYGARSIYSNNLPRSADFNDANGGNDSFAAATDITQHILTDGTVLRENRDISIVADVDFFRLTAPADTFSSVQIGIQSSGLSLLAPKVTVYAADQTTILGSATGLNQYGTTLVVNLESQVAPGQVIYVKVQGADATPFATGKYAISASFAGTPLRWQVPPVTQTANGLIRSGGGGIAQAQSQEYVVNTQVADLQETSALNRQAVAMDANGNYVVVWASKDQSGSGWGVYGQRFDTAGTPLGNEFRVNTRTTGDQTFPAVAMAGSGTFVVTWSSENQDGESWGVYAQRFNAAGVPQGSEFRVNYTTKKEQMYSAVAMNAYGGFVITWSSASSSYSSSGSSGSSGSWTGSTWDVYAKLYAPWGSSLTGEMRVNSTTSKDQMYSAAAIDEWGNFVITWSSKDQDGSGWGVYARRFELDWDDGDLKDVDARNEFRVNTTTGSDQNYSSIAMNKNGFVVTWTSDGQDGSGSGIYARRFTTTGAPLSSEFQVSVTTEDSQIYSSVAMNSDGNFIIVWSSYGQDGDGSGVYGRQYMDDGTPKDDIEFQVNLTVTDGDQSNASIARNGHGHIVVVWTGPGENGSADVFAERFVVGADDLMPMKGFEEVTGCGCPICLGVQSSLFPTDGAGHEDDLGPRTSGSVNWLNEWTGKATDSEITPEDKTTGVARHRRLAKRQTAPHQDFLNEDLATV